MVEIRFNLKELDAWKRKLKLCALDSTRIAKMALYDAAKVGADALREAVNGLDRVPDVVAINAAKRGEPTVLSVNQKNGLRRGLSIHPMIVKSNKIEVRIRFDGYNSIVTKRWPNGQPNQMVAGSCESGSSAMIKQPFIRTTRERISPAAIRAMVYRVTEEFDKILDE